MNNSIIPNHSAKESRVSYNHPAQKLLSLFSQSPTAIAILQGPEHVYSFANPEYQKLFGRTEKQLLGKALNEVFPEIAGQGIYEVFDNAFKSGQLFRGDEFPATYRTGTETKKGFYNFSIQPIKDDEGNVTDLLVQAYDITKQVETQKKAEENAEKYRTLFQSMDQGFCIIEMIFDANKKPVDYLFLEANPVFESQTGLKGVVGKTAKELLPDLEEHWFQTYGNVALTGEAVRFTQGSETMGRWFEVYAFHIGGDQSKRVAILFTDISDRRKAEDVIKERENYFRKLTNTAPVIIWITEPDGSCSYLNKHWYEYTGQTEEEAEGFGWLDATHPDDKEDAGRIFIEANTKQKPFSLFYRLRHRNGDYRWAKDSGSPKFSKEGVYDGFIGTVVDVHEEKLAEERLRHSEEQFKNITETIPQLVWVCNSQGEVIYFNDKWYDFTGQGPEQSLGNGWSNLLHPDDVTITLEKWNEAQQSIEPFATEYRLQTAGGGYRWVFSRGVPIKNKDGKIERWFGTCTDIHEQKNIEHTLRESQARFQNLVRDASAAIIVLTGTEMKVEIVNEAYARLLNLRPEELFGKKLFTVIPQAEEYYRPLLQKVLSTGESVYLHDSPYSVTIHGEKREGFLHVVYQPYRDAQENILGVMAICQDVTESVKARRTLEENEATLQKQVADRTRDLAEANQTLQDINKELLRSNQNLEEFAHAASHDLKEPIRKIHFFTNQLKDQLSKHLSENETRLFNRIENASERMGSLVDDLLLYSHVSQRPADKEEVDLNEKIKRVLEDLELDVQEKAAVITVEPLPKVKGYRRQLQQMLQNLLSNAIKYTMPGKAPEVNISATKKEENGKSYHCISVADNGIGFGQEYAEKIFQMFTRLHGKNEYSGTGVGLSIVKKVVENHDGFIDVKSAPGEGARFDIYLPA